MEVEELTVAFSDEDTGEEVIKELDIILLLSTSRVRH